MTEKDKLTDMEKFSAEAVYDIMTQIPRGKVVSYGEIATLMGQPQKSAHVGVAMKGAFERGLPYHRVVFSDGSLVPGWPEQEELLKAEGVVIKKNGKVDMRQSAWRPLETIY
jgi:methylated-DNA-protein-cysteine methyltransferase-like protein